MAKENSKKKLYVILGIVLVVVILAVVIAYFCFGTTSIKDEVITAENYEELTDRFQEELGESDDIYYLSYSMMYYIFSDGLSAAFSGSSNEEDMYVNIYGKTVGQLIEEGKQLMEENGTTIDEYKESLEELSTDAE